jgi:ribosome-binding protein aMBF1 (putative translation factor)
MSTRERSRRGGRRRQRASRDESEPARRARELLLDEYPEVREEYERMRPRFDAVSQLIAMRNEAGLTQAELAERMGRRQSVVSAIESGRREPRLSTLSAAARAMGHELRIDFVPIEGGDEADADAAGGSGGAR